MATKSSLFAILNRSTIPFFTVFSFFCHAAFGSVTLQSPASLLAANVPQEPSKLPSRFIPKSSIEISDPGPSTVWVVSQQAKIQWKTVNIDTVKSIRFFLAKDDMVVQELGSFKNNSLAEGIALAKNVGSGDQYQVVGIELFPDNKFQVAKNVTPYFSIRNPIADARKKVPLAKRGIPDKNNDSRNPESRAGNMFEGRKISYVKELTFAHEEIIVSLWDHGRQDGDIVSIYLNGKIIISKYHLTYRRKEVHFKLDPDKANDLFLYAHNLGDSPPNTVSLELTDGSTSEKIILNSDLKSCEAVQIKVSK